MFADLVRKNSHKLRNEEGKNGHAEHSEARSSRKSGGLQRLQRQTSKCASLSPYEVDMTKEDLRW